MYFNSSELNFKSYKLKLLNEAFFRRFEDFDEIQGLSKSEIEAVKSLFAKECEELAAMPSVKQSVKRPIVSEPQKSLHINLVKVLEDLESNTFKALFELKDGSKIESVLMRFKDGRNSVCVSTQVGCPVGCIFCASGKMGFYRNLQYVEIVDQVLFWSKWLKTKPNDNIDKAFSKVNHNNDFERVTNIVYMGMGEPMLNYVNTVESIRILTDEMQFGLGDRHITVSSSGYIPQLEKYMEEGFKTRLAISLHAPNQKIREELMPVAKVYSLDRLLEFCKKYEVYSHKRISYEYTMISGVNDTVECAMDLARMLRRRDAHVNLIPLNPIANTSLKKSTRDAIMDFFDILQKHKIPSTIRITMGDRIQAACGQLANQN